MYQAEEANKCRVDQSGKPRIIHILDHSLPLHSGYTFRTVSILREQNKNGYATYQLTGPKQGPSKGLIDEVDGLRFFRTPIKSAFFSNWPVLRHWNVSRLLKKRLSQIVCRLKPDVLHAHSPVLDAMAALSVGRKRHVPVVYEIRAFWEDAAVSHGTTPEWGIRYRLTRLLETWAVRRADAVVAICEGLKADLIERGVRPDKITVVPNAIDPARFLFKQEPDQKLLRRLDLTSGSTLGFAGSFYKYEGLDLLIKALPRIVKEIPTIKLILLGGGPEEVKLKAMVSDLGLNGRVHFIGRVPQKLVTYYSSVIDVMVFPRISCRLTELVTPLKPLEAMAMGKLVTASNVGGHRELIKDKETGFLFRSDSVVDLQDCLLSTLKNTAAWSNVLHAGRSYVENERNWGKNIRLYDRVYTKLLNNSPRFVGGNHAI